MTTVGTVRPRAFTERALLWLTLGWYAAWHVGGHVDAWYHLQYGFTIESFIVWPHVLLYAGVAGTAVAVAAYLAESLARDEPRAAWLPRGFGSVLLGALLFLVGGVVDFAWHSAFGFEVNLETLLSPAHLWLLLAAMIAGFGLFRASVEQRRRAGPPAIGARLVDVPVVLSVALLFRLVLWSFFYSEPSAIDFASGGFHAGRLHGYAGIAWEDLAARVAGVTGIILHSVFLALFLVVPLRQLVLPRGAIVTIVGWDAILVAAVTDMWLYLPAALGGALTGELIWARMWRGVLSGLHGDVGYWALGAAVPTVQLLIYFAVMTAFGGGSAWTTHLWAGAPLMAGLYGLITSLLVVPPKSVRGER